MCVDLTQSAQYMWFGTESVYLISISLMCLCSIIDNVKCYLDDLWLDIIILCPTEYCRKLNKSVKSCEGSGEIIARYGCQ